MGELLMPEGYKSPLTIRETEVAIKEVKDHFERALAKSLHLTRVSAPLFVKPQTGLNDNLNGVERPVAFGIKEQDDDIAEIVHSLAKWKRYALKRYEFHSGEGLYTDMSAIRRDEDTDNIHSIYVDQWDWEKVISKEERNTETLQYTVRKVYAALKDTEDYMSRRYNYIEALLPDDITFITSQELEDMYPGMIEQYTIFSGSFNPSGSSPSEKSCKSIFQYLSFMFMFFMIITSIHPFYACLATVTCT